jgi:hypothetical protein
VRLDGRAFGAAWALGVCLALCAGGCNQILGIEETDATMEVIELPLLGRLTTTVVAGTSVDRPDACSWYGGSANLTTAYSIDDNDNPVFTVEGEESWACIPFVGMATF